jgi:CMP-N,N'-diacetyllegionaminic acid synthase
MNTSESICLIPAKAASERLKKKNLLPLKGKELLAYPILAALGSGVFGDEVIVSTESEEIRDVALRYGAKVPYLREERLAHDPYQIVDVAVDFFDKNSGYKNYKTLCIMLPSAPLVQTEDVCKAIDFYRKNNLKYLMSVTESDHNALRAVLVRDDLIDPLFRDKITRRSQELEKTYRINGAIIITDIQDFLRTGTYFNYPLGAYIMPPERSVDIDTEFDYRVAQIMIESNITGQ